jgi:hypothetical protein
MGRKYIGSAVIQQASGSVRVHIRTEVQTRRSRSTFVPCHPVLSNRRLLSYVGKATTSAVEEILLPKVRPSLSVVFKSWFDWIDILIAVNYEHS